MIKEAKRQSQNDWKRQMSKKTSDIYRQRRKYTGNCYMNKVIIVVDPRTVRDDAHILLLFGTTICCILITCQQRE